MIHNLATTESGHDSRKLNVDLVAWTNFDDLKMEFLKHPPKKNVDKYNKLTSMYLDNEPMMALGLVAVLESVTEMCLAVDLNNPEGVCTCDGGECDHEFEMVDYLHGEPHSSDLFTLSKAAAEVDASTSSLFNTTVMPSYSSMKRKKLYTASSAQSQDMFKMPKTSITHSSPYTAAALGADWANYLKSSLDLAQPIAKVTETDMQFAVRTTCNSNLQKLFSDGRIVTMALASAEKADVVLVEKLSEFEWVFRALNKDSADRVLSRGQFRVLGFNLVANEIIPSL